MLPERPCDRPDNDPEWARAAKRVVSAVSAPLLSLGQANPVARASRFSWSGRPGAAVPTFTPIPSPSTARPARGRYGPPGPRHASLDEDVAEDVEKCPGGSIVGADGATIAEPLNGGSP
jgi:hypothetical protein